MQKASYNLISYETGLDRKTIWRVMKAVSSVLVPKYYKNECIIGGQDIIVEIDEFKFGKRKYNKGHRVEGIWVFGMVEKTDQRRIKLMAVDNRKENTLTQQLVQNIDSNSILYSDCWKGYKKIIERFAKHLTVNHSKNYKDPTTGCHTNTIEGNWAGIKMHIPSAGKSKERIHLYLVRYMLLRNETSHPLISILKYLF